MFALHYLFNYIILFSLISFLYVLFGAEIKIQSENGTN